MAMHSIIHFHINKLYESVVLDPNPSSLTLALTVSLTLLMRQVATELDPNPRSITHANTSGLAVLIR